MMLATALLLALFRTPAMETVTYRTVGDTELKMDVFPVSQPNGPVPCVVVIHGGAWMSGKREDMAPISQAIAANGMVAAAISYRLAPANKWPAMIEDAQAAVRYLRDNAAKYNIDPKRIGACGASAGGHLSLLLGTTEGWPDGTKTATSSKVMAVFNLFGPFDCTQDFPATLGMLLSQSIIGKKFEEAKEDIRLFSPATYVTKDDAPVFTLQGKEDPLVPFKQAERLDAAMKAAGLSHTLRLVEGMKHGIDQTKTEETKGVSDGIAWLKERLGA